MENQERRNSNFFSVVTDGQTYINIVYLLMAFPLGLFYFIFLVVGLSVGVGLSIIWVGIPILLFMMLSWWALALFERQMANSLLHTHIEYPYSGVKPNDSLWIKFKAHLRNPFTWKGLVYLFMKFPIGIASFVITITLGVVSLSMLGAPIFYDEYWYYSDFNHHDFPFMYVDTLGEAVLVALLGLVIAILSLHIFNMLANVLKKFTDIMLSQQ